MHYGKYASLYLKRTFFFDANPPLGKLLIAAVGYLAGFDGDFDFAKIGTAYTDDVPVFALRLLPAVAGAGITPTVYLILMELGLGVWASALAGIMVILDTAILAQSRFILLESIMIVFSLIAVLATLKFTKVITTWSIRWWFWLTTLSTTMGMAFCVKFMAIYSCWLCSALLLRSFWRRLADNTLSNVSLAVEFAVQAFVVVAVPLSIYVGSFYVHLAILTKAGVHDALMTSAFQASLEGGLSSIVEGQPKVIAHGSQITLRHTHGKTCWLHSHEHVYPVR